MSEIMLQQTPVSRVLRSYARFLARFPTVTALRRASLGDVLVEWGTLGYPRRARDLHRAVRSVRRLPRDPAALDRLPGVGRYTAGAVACFSTGTAVAFADTNIRRVLGRVLLGRTATEREALELDAAHMPRRAAARWHHALMDLGATICTARAPRCDRCPIFAVCVAKGRDAAPLTRRQAAFATSDRRVRGEIMKALRERRALSRAALARLVADPRTERLVDDLRAEGMLVVRRGRVALP